MTSHRSKLPIVAFSFGGTLRLYPILLVTLSVAAILNIEGIRETYFWDATYLTNFYILSTDIWPDASAHFWTLAVEAQFYLLWPFLIFFVPRHVLPWAMVAVIVASLVFRLVWHGLEISDLGTKALPLGSFDALALGSLLALSRKWVVPVGIAGLCLWLATNQVWFGKHWVVEIAATGAAMFFALAVSLAAGGWSVLNNAVLQYIGTISYGIYVLHYPVWFGLEQKSVALALCLTVGLAALSWHLMESPIIRWGRRYTSQSRTDATPIGDSIQSKTG